MAQRSGVLVRGTLRIADDTMPLPIAKASEIEGGCHAVETIAERNALPAYLRVWGVQCRVTNDGADSGMYYLKYNHASTDLTDNDNWAKDDALSRYGDVFEGPLLAKGAGVIDTEDTEGEDVLKLGTENADVVEIGREGKVIRLLGAVEWQVPYHEVEFNDTQEYVDVDWASLQEKFGPVPTRFIAYQQADSGYEPYHILFRIDAKPATTVRVFTNNENGFFLIG